MQESFRSAFEGNSFAPLPCDEHTLGEYLRQVEFLTGKCPEVGILGRGCKGKNIDNTEIVSPFVSSKKALNINKRKPRSVLEQVSSL